MQEKGKSLYFIAIIPPGRLCSDLMQLKNEFYHRFNSKASLNSEPHITLHMPFRYRNSKREKLLQTLKKFSESRSPFHVKLRNFGAFEPRAIFVDVEKSEELISLQKELVKICRQELNLDNANYRGYSFYPHITLAFRDLRKPQFHEAWTEFREREFSASFITEQFFLLRHDGKFWQRDHAWQLIGS